MPAGRAGAMTRAAPSLRHANLNRAGESPHWQGEVSPEGGGSLREEPQGGRALETAFPSAGAQLTEAYLVLCAPAWIEIL
ncbi:hypothetical protein [Kamptonema formosum]|uniref:hypothetical protein n=1 Tax=Kamptonema formosum TaxID=331992 RepID=UPI0003485F61|nr:hypothetical protein [Oscillatoria sp. PCC 10802]